MNTLGAFDWFLIGGFLIVGVGVTVALTAKSFIVAMEKLEEKDSTAMVERLFEHKKRSEAIREEIANGARLSNNA